MEDVVLVEDTPGRWQAASIVRGWCCWPIQTTYYLTSSLGLPPGEKWLSAPDGRPRVGILHHLCGFCDGIYLLTMSFCSLSVPPPPPLHNVYARVAVV